MNTTEIICPSGLVLEGKEVLLEDLDVFTNRKLAKQSVVTGEAALADRLCVKVIDRGPYLFDGAKPPWGQQVLYGDLFYFLVQCRIFTRGSNFDFDIQCPAQSCRKMIEWRLPLDELYVQDLPEGSKAMLRNGENRIPVHLPNCDRTVSFTLLDGHTHKRQRRYVQDHGDHLRVIYAARLCDIEGEEHPDYLGFASKMHPEDFDVLYEACEEHDCGMDAAYEVQCPHRGCELIFEDNLGISPDFFIESASKHSRRRRKRRRRTRSVQKTSSPVGGPSSPSTA